MLVTATARLRFASIPARKMRLVADQIKGLPVLLNFTPRIAARHIAKTVKSAAANALSQEGTDRLRPEDLLVKNIYVDMAPAGKRIRFRSMGRVYRYRKHVCHLTVQLEGELGIEPAAKKRAPRAVKAEAETPEKTAAETTPEATEKQDAAPGRRTTTAKKRTEKTGVKRTAPKRTGAKKDSTHKVTSRTKGGSAGKRIDTGRKEK